MRSHYTTSRLLSNHDSSLIAESCRLFSPAQLMKISEGRGRQRKDRHAPPFQSKETRHYVKILKKHHDPYPVYPDSPQSHASGGMASVRTDQRIRNPLKGSRSSVTCSCDVTLARFSTPDEALLVISQTDSWRVRSDIHHLFDALPPLRRRHPRRACIGGGVVAAEAATHRAQTQRREYRGLKQRETKARGGRSVKSRD